jgi:hypothetical protein
MRGEVREGGREGGKMREGGGGRKREGGEGGRGEGGRDRGGWDLARRRKRVGPLEK